MKPLSAGAALWAAISASPALAAVGAAAEAATFGTGGNRGSGEEFERELGRLLTGAVQDSISADVRAALPAGVPGMGPVLAISWLVAGGRKGFDFAVQTYTTGGDVRTDWVNVKRCAGSTTNAEAAALNTVLRVARGEDIALPGRLNIPRTLLGWFAGREKIADSDYQLLEFVCDDGALQQVRSQGLLSSVTNNKLACHIHTNRDVVQYQHSAEVLPDSFDVNQALPEALTRTPNADDLRLELLTFVAEQRGLSRAQRKRLAGRLLDASDDAVTAALLAAVEGLTAP